MFSARLPDRLTSNALTRAVAAHRAGNRPIIDLTCTNPTDVGLPYPADVLRPLADHAGVRYRPEPRGRRETRVLVSRDYEAPGAVDPDAIVLTASTSEAYSWLFKLLCDPGTDVLVPQPSYPLFELLTRLDAVATRPYALDYHGRWTVDRESLAGATGPQTRAVLVVSPNNPTGSWLSADDREWLVAHAAAHDLAIISDEVFADYPLSRRSDASSLVAESRVLTFTLGGLSKSAGLPQVKLGWIVVSGPQPEVDEALRRLDVISDSYLSVSTPVQVAAPRLFKAGRKIRRAIHERVRHNLDQLRQRAAGHPAVELREPEGGWSAVMRVPVSQPEEDLVIELLERTDVLVHPGFFFDFPHEAFLVLSLLPDPAIFDEAVSRMLPVVDGTGA
ncbi:MAG TPA: pyridoxal phosphate-dependent aminotransferase [Vicinamibacterales bacterium]|nr:pyridoxal phosphate-dependent aminotransferase [Vicinamibacterales bacterium]